MTSKTDESGNGYVNPKAELDILRALKIDHLPVCELSFRLRACEIATATIVIEVFNEEMQDLSTLMKRFYLVPIKEDDDPQPAS